MDEDQAGDHKQQQQPQQPTSEQNDKSNGEVHQDGTNNETAAVAPTGGQTDQIKPRQQRPRRPRPLRPNQFRMVALAPGGGQQLIGGEHVPIIETIAPQALISSGTPMEARIELASGVLQPASGRATMVPPKRPNYLPMARHFVAAAQAPSSYAALHHHHQHSGNNQTAPSGNNISSQHHHQLHRFQPTTSLGATALNPNSSNKPNRYSWAQMQQWHAAQSAAAAQASVVAVDATGGPVDASGGPAGQTPASGFHYHLPTPFSTAASRVLFVPNPIVNLSEHTKSRLVKFIEAIKRFSEKWFSHVLLLLFLASYACFGAYIFISFEAPNEQWEKQLIIDTRLRIVNESYDQAQELGSRELFVDAFRQRFEEYERLLNRACASGMTSNSLDNQWTFWGALFYSMTVFTTIGYGHLTPVTFAGRVATMIYAIFGIPILLMVLADLGKLLTRIIKYAFKKFRYLYSKLLGRKASVRTRQLITDNTNQYIGQARHAFERGFATYIQPYQARLPNAFQPREFRSQNRKVDPAELASDHVSVNLVKLDEAQLESSDVIITPAKQTKPVSPQIDSSHDATTAGPQLIPKEDTPQQHNDHNNHHHHSSSSNNNGHNQPTSKHKDKTKKARKISANQKVAPAELKASESSHQRRPSQRQPVARSSSATNVDLMGPKSALFEKRASLDQQPQQQLTRQTALEQGASHSKLASPPDSYLDQSQHQHDDLESRAPADQMDEEEFVDELDDDLDIPVSFALFLLITYMMFGAVVFSIWESWNFFDSLYFVFISMSTIGFGDLVPQHPKRMIGTFAYLLFGLALTSMCINVVQEKIHATFLRAKMQIGEKMGFDLDQIMADDYYHDGGSAFGDESDGQLDDNGSYANSIALSHTNSTTVTGDQPPGQHQQQVAANELRASQLVATAHQVATDQTLAQMSRSKSKESLKWKKRSLSGAAGSGAGASLSAADQHSIGSSCRRKTSFGSKKAAAATSQARHNQMVQQQQQQQQQISKEPTNGPQEGPIKHQIETIRMVNVPVMLQLEEKPSQPNKPQPLQQQPSINQPIDGGVKAFCEPLRRANSQAASNQPRRARLVASRSQPSSPYQLLNGSHQQLVQQRPATGAATTTDRDTNSATLAPRHHHYSGGAPFCRDLNGGRPNRNGRSRETMTRSLAGSRRGSVSDELNQLDDLIVALSKSPHERFGPLLGIPASRRSSRSNSPASPARRQATISSAASPLPAGGVVASQRRGTSLMVRGSNESVLSAGRRTPLGRLVQEKLGTSFGSATTQTPPFLTPSGSSNLLASSDHQHQRMEPMSGRRKSSSSSSASRGFAVVSARQSENELSVSESQAALDELEALRFSAV